MILLIFAIRDRQTDNYGNPVFAFSAGQAVRSFGDEINKPGENNPYYQHPEDYDLYMLGEFDTNTGVITASAPSQVILGSALKK